ncbi:MAG: exodeoxyribonuclease III [Acidobacteriota bacterium]
MKIATWNVNGIRARQAQLLEWIGRERPDVLCLQEIKASLDQLTFDLRDIDGYWTHWHGEKGYSGVALLVSRAFAPEAPDVTHPPFDVEQRVSATTLRTSAGAVTFASVYVPNGGKDYAAKLTFLEGMETWVAGLDAAGRPVVLCGDLNVARTDRDIHPKERKPNQVGARADERALIEQILSRGLVDVGRALDPDNDQLFTWWAPWRSLRERNIGWRIDYVLASANLGARARRAEVQREFGTSDHGPVVVEFEL